MTNQSEVSKARVVGMVELHRTMSRVIDEVRVGRAEVLVMSHGRPMAMIRPLTPEEQEAFAEAEQSAA